MFVLVKTFTAGINVHGVFRAGGPPLKMPATDAGETSGTHNLRPRTTSPEDTMYITNVCLIFLKKNDRKRSNIIINK